MDKMAEKRKKFISLSWQNMVGKTFSLDSAVIVYYFHYDLCKEMYRAESSFLVICNFHIYDFFFLYEESDTSVGLLRRVHLTGFT